MKTVDRVLADIERRLTATWASCIAQACISHARVTEAGESPSRTDLVAGQAAGRDPTPTSADQTTPPASWPIAFFLGRPTSTRLADDFAGAADWAATWRTWSATHDTALRTESRRVLGTDQQFPAYLVVDSMDAAAQLCGHGWPARLTRGRHRARLLADRFPHLADAEQLAATVAAVDELSDVDFDLLCRAGQWFATHDASGLTPRQVPIEGLHAKWLNHRHALLRRLSGRDDLGLLPRHPSRVHFTYLDPAHLAAGRRRHDSATVGDHALPAYPPQVVVISENKDTAIHFPELPGGISVEGVGRGATAIAALPWLTAAPHILYWGDMDADGLEILNEFRAAGIPATSMFMDPAAYEQWQRFGTNEDAKGGPLRARTPRPVPFLTAPETALYLNLTAPTWPRPRRVEQERIPLTHAAAHVRDTLENRRRQGPP